MTTSLTQIVALARHPAILTVAEALCAREDYHAACIEGATALREGGARVTFSVTVDLVTTATMRVMEAMRAHSDGARIASVRALTLVAGVPGYGDAAVIAGLAQVDDRGRVTWRMSLLDFLLGSAARSSNAERQARYRGRRRDDPSRNFVAQDVTPSDGAQRNGVAHDVTPSNGARRNGVTREGGVGGEGARNAQGCAHVDEERKQLFDAFWRDYPARGGRKLNKPKALAVFARLRAEDVPRVMQAVRNYVAGQSVHMDAHRFLTLSALGHAPWHDFVDDVPAAAMVNGNDRRAQENLSCGKLHTSNGQAPLEAK